jgi:hypothetical protein
VFALAHASERATEWCSPALQVHAAEHGVAADSPPSLSLGPLAALARLAAERPTVRPPRVVLRSHRSRAPVFHRGEAPCGIGRGLEEWVPDMALQRTPRPRFLKVQSGLGAGDSVQEHAGTGRSLCSLGAPLNAQPLDDVQFDIESL